MKIATDINAETFYSIIEFLTKNGWKITVEYDERIFDKGIDFDFYKLEKNEDIIYFAWCNWFEGEIKATTKILNKIAKRFDFELNFGAAEYLQNSTIIEDMKPLLKFKK
ncbi:MAG: hypothetical protein ACK5NB_00390 [Flavobacteriaceae bacterium]